MTTATIRQFSATASARVDMTNGVIYGVSLITCGPAHGHGVNIDIKTLEQVKIAAANYSGGLKVKMDHGGGAGDIVGYIDQLRIVGPKLIGDLHLLQTSEHRQYVLEIATRIPDTFGLSIAFSGISETTADNMVLQRCSEIYSVDLVSEPAANPDGLFSRGKSDKPATSEHLTKMETPATPPADPIAEALSQFAARLAKLEAFAFPPAAEPKKEEPMACAAKTDPVMLALKEFAKTFGAPAATVSPAAPVAPAAPTVKTFADLVAAKRLELKGDNAAAITAVISSNPTEYAVYRAQFGQGQVIKL